MFISEILGDANFGLALLTVHFYLRVIIIHIRIDCFTNTDRDRLNWFETVLR